MKDTKSLLLIIISFLLLSVSMALLWTWGYKIGNEKGVEESKFVVIKDSNQTASPVKDSLFRLYVDGMNNLNDLDAALNKADSLKSDINNKIGEFYQIRDELLAMLNKPTTKTIISDADTKLGDLKKRMDQLKVQNNIIELENKRLAALLSRLPSNMKPDIIKNVDTADLVVDTAVIQANKVLDPIRIIDNFIVTCNYEKEGDRIESDSSYLVEKITGNFNFISPSYLTSPGVLYVVITCPNGKVMKSAGWDSGAFESKDVRKIYTCSVSYLSMPGETQPLSFSVPYENFQKGSYQIEVYLDGNLIMTTSKFLY